MIFEGFPFIVGWELTLSCNLRCRHCGSSAGLPRSHELSIDECFAVSDQFPDLLVREVDFTGGEPMHYPGWQALAEHIIGLGIDVKLLTNGTGLTPEAINEILDSGIAEVGVSLDGLGLTHDYIRGSRGAFLQLLEGIDGLLKAGLDVTAITTVYSRNVGELPSLFVLLKSLGVRRWQIQPLFPLGRGREVIGFWHTADSYLALGSFVQHWGKEALDCGMEIIPGDSFGYFGERDTRDPPWRGCPAGLVSCGITSDGKVKGCLSLPDSQVEGDLRQDTMWDIWFRPEAFAYTRQHKVQELGDNCRGCDHAEQCRGGCSAMSFGASGRYHNDPYCFTRLQRTCNATAISFQDAEDPPNMERPTSRTQGTCSPPRESP